MTRIVLVGHGAFGSLYRERLQEMLTVKLVGLVDSNTDHLDPSVPVHAMTLQHLIDNLDFDAVVISTPPQEHFHIARQALMSGKDVFCAKPGTLKLSHMMELQALADKNKKKLYIDYTMLASPENNTLDQLFSALGEPMHMEAHRHTVGRPRPEGIIYDLICHDVATFLYHFDDTKITSVECFDVDHGGEMGATARLFNEDEREVATMRASYDRVLADKRVKFHLHPTAMVEYVEDIEWDQVDRIVTIGRSTPIEFRKQPDPITLSIDRFVMGTYDHNIQLRTAAICEMLAESYDKLQRVEAP